MVRPSYILSMIISIEALFSTRCEYKRIRGLFLGADQWHNRLREAAGPGAWCGRECCPPPAKIRSSSKAKGSGSPSVMIDDLTGRGNQTHCWDVQFARQFQSSACEQTMQSANDPDLALGFVSGCAPGSSEIHSDGVRRLGLLLTGH